MNDRDDEFEALLERSSLGTPGARQLRERTSLGQVAVARRIDELRTRIARAGQPRDSAAAAVELIQLLYELGYLRQARQALRQALALWRRLDTENPVRHQLRSEFADTLTELAVLLQDQRSNRFIERALQEAVAMDADEPVRRRLTGRQDVLPGQAAAAPQVTGTTPVAAVRAVWQTPAQGSDRVIQAVGVGSQYIYAPAQPSPAAARNTLPRANPAFTDRDDELDGLIGRVTDLMTAEEAIPIFAIGGMPGVGKTTFAVHVAHRLSQSFPDGQIFVDMHAHTAGKAPVEPAGALFALLSVDGVPTDDIPDELDSRSALWRARMATRKSILIIDNVASHRQVEPLLPRTANCLVLVTSRRRLTGLGARQAVTTVSLDPLPPGPAADLFMRLTGRPAGGREDGAISELVRLCGYLPLAISLLAARLRPEPKWQVQTLVDDLTAAQDRLAHIRAEDIQVAAAFDLSYRSLPAERQRFFRRLALSPTDFDASAAAALGDVGPATARRHLDALYDDHLVDQPVRGRYRLHDLLRAYASALVATHDGPQLRDLAIGRLLDYYQHGATIADQPIAPRPRQTTTMARADRGATTLLAEEEILAPPAFDPLGGEKGRRIIGAERQILAKDLVKRYSEGESIRALASATGRSYGFVHRVLTESGVQLRQRGGARRRRKKT